ncbi:hypothetical protein Ciccas_013292, partial [Cichlidogyrus casuarinus]
FTFVGLSPSTSYTASVVTKYSDSSESAAVSSNTVTTPSTKQSTPESKSWAVLTVNINKTDGTEQIFTPSMAVRGSASYLRAQEQFCALAQLALRNSDSGLNVDSCQLVNISPGSVVTTGNLTLSSVSSNSPVTIDPDKLKYRLFSGSSLTPPKAISNVGAAFNMKTLEVRQVSSD